jgi:hypothetical protein
MLYNLQTLLLEGCCELTELPSKFSKLINLRHLELPFDVYHNSQPCIKKMPKNIGDLNKLQSLPYLIVEEQNGSVLKELEKLNHLQFMEELIFEDWVMSLILQMLQWPI